VALPEELESLFEELFDLFVEKTLLGDEENERPEEALNVTFALS
jgi:hypothetical protein